MWLVWAAMGAEMMEADRAATARKNVEPALRRMAERAGLRHPVRRIFLRSLKRERLLEAWGADGPSRAMKLLQTYEVKGQSGGLGPKRKEGDRQVPEGFYHIDRFNPLSRFHLSLGVNYPNASDRILSDSERPGGDIFIHGDVLSVGCLAITDAKIEEVYILAENARLAGQRRIPVHFFPGRMDAAGWRDLQRLGSPQLVRFWGDLKSVWDRFEKTKIPPAVRVDGQGRYRLAARG